MFDRLATDGDRTSTGGEVIGRSGMYDERGHMYARKGNKATCGKCEGVWEIYGTADDWLDDGYPMVKDGDRVLCPCGQNFVFAWGGSNALFTEGQGEQEVSTSSQSRNSIYDEQAVARCVSTSLVGYPYVIQKSDGGTFSGRVDDSHRLPRIYTETADSYEIYWGDEALAHEGWM
ncbi:PAAR domain-containing protein [Paraburkholderia sp. J41]|uniref:PAAR domain-containing protein n=1 Tax=Paraburkholderia sp. J41 TaxID=2805433 RepID=UPI002AC36182|nr:PAAR domain-containing protein [Paraburkholderia sp. J41]